MKRIQVFSNRYPYLGPAVWICSLQYFIVQLVVASAWHHPSYSWRFNTISDLGNTAHNMNIGRLVDSPLHTLMNSSFIALGILMTFGALLIYHEFVQTKVTFIGFICMALSGFGTVLVGLFPENTVATFHVLGASLPFSLGNLGLIILGLGLQNIARGARLYSVVSGVIAVSALVLFLGHNYLGLGIGGMERITAYPQTIWLIFFGLYMTRRHYLQQKTRSKPDAR